MKKKPTTTTAKVGVGPQRIKSVAKELRKQYGPMLKRLATLLKVVCVFLCCSVT